MFLKVSGGNLRGVVTNVLMSVGEEQAVVHWNGLVIRERLLSAVYVLC